MTNQFDYRYRWRFTDRSLALLEADTLVGELVRLEGGEWALFGYEGTTQCAGTRRTDELSDLVTWAEQRLTSEGVIEDASIDRFAVMGGQDG